MKKSESLLVHLARKRMSQGELAQKSGLSRMRINKIINSEANVEASTMRKICSALGISPMDIEEFNLSDLETKE